MASNQTQHLKLCQWEADDEVLRADFNADNAKIDTAVASVEQKLNTAAAEAQRKLDTAVAGVEQKVNAAANTAQAALKAAQAGYGPDNRPFVVGTYTGNAANVGDTPMYQTISLGFAPSYVRVFDLMGYYQYNYVVPSRGLYEADAAPGIPVPFNSPALEVTENGFTVSARMSGDYFAYPALNIDKKVYGYIAFR